jgi:hypothetical protein
MRKNTSRDDSIANRIDHYKRKIRPSLTKVQQYEVDLLTKTSLGALDELYELMVKKRDKGKIAVFKVVSADARICDSTEEDLIAIKESDSHGVKSLYIDIVKHNRVRSVKQENGLKYGDEVQVYLAGISRVSLGLLKESIKMLNSEPHNSASQVTWGESGGSSVKLDIEDQKPIPVKPILKAYSGGGGVQQRPQVSKLAEESKPTKHNPDLRVLANAAEAATDKYERSSANKGRY